MPLIASDPNIEKVEIAGPGFINLTLARAFWPSVLRLVLESGDAYGRSAVGKGHAVNVEYVSANPTGPMHVGIVAAPSSAMRLPTCLPLPGTT